MVEIEECSGDRILHTHTLGLYLASCPSSAGMARQLLCYWHVEKVQMPQLSYTTRLGLKWVRNAGI